MLIEMKNLFKHNIPLKYIKISMKKYNVRRWIVLSYNLESYNEKESDYYIILSVSLQYFG